MTATRMIHLGFPEWTIWALPLAAYELGKLVASQDTALKEKVMNTAAAKPLPPATVEAALGDAFATYAVGPAYACAAIMMRLNPRASMPGGPPIDDMRARVIFAMLKLANTHAGQGIDFDNAVEPSVTAWNEALEESGAVAGADAVPTTVADIFWKWADSAYVTAKYQPQAWLIAQRLSAALERRINQEPPAADDPMTIAAGSTDVRDMLNAAWLHRLRHPNTADAASDAVLALWQEAKTIFQSPNRFGGSAVPGLQERRKS